MGFHLERAGRDYIILERDSSAGKTDRSNKKITVFVDLTVIWLIG